jgi:hypothetical protein
MGPFIPDAGQAPEPAACSRVRRVLLDDRDLGRHPGRRGCRVRMETRLRGADEVGGFFERPVASHVLRRLLVEELERLDRYAQIAPPG